MACKALVGAVAGVSVLVTLGLSALAIRHGYVSPHAESWVMKRYVDKIEQLDGVVQTQKQSIEKQNAALKTQSENIRIQNGAIEYQDERYAELEVQTKELLAENTLLRERVGNPKDRLAGLLAIYKNAPPPVLIPYDLGGTRVLLGKNVYGGVLSYVPNLETGQFITVPDQNFFPEKLFEGQQPER